MRRTERKKIETVKSGNQIWGHITLNNLANPESIRITINGDKIKPTSYDIYGSPEFPKELVEYYNWKEQEIRIKNGKKDFILKAEVSYEERPFDIPTKCFDSKEGIKKSLNSLKDFTEMLNKSRSVVADELMFTATHKFFDNMSKEEIMRWANTCMNFV